MALQANSTFLPVLDDLLSPEFRPILQTPTSCVTTPLTTFGMSNPPFNANPAFTNGKDLPPKFSKGLKAPHRSQSVPSQLVSHVPNEAASKIQNWWRRRNEENGGVDLRAERAKHSIRHRRTEEHVQHLENEVKHLKAALCSERKLRSLQVEAIKSLWSQVQRISTPESTRKTLDNVGIMSQSMPNGLPLSNSSSPRKRGLKGSGMSMSYAGETLPEDQDLPACTSACAKEIENLRETLSGEISQLRDMIAKLRAPEQGSEVKGKIPEATSDSSDEKESRPAQAQRPISLNIKGNQPQSETSELLSELPEAEEIVDFASQMASKLLEDAVDDNEKSESTHSTPQKMISSV